MSILDILTETINSTLNLFLAYWLFDSFFEKHTTRWKNITIFVMVDLAHTFLLLFYKGTIINFVGIYILSTILSYMFRAKFLHRLTYTALFYGITAAVEMIVAMVVNGIFNVTFIDGKQGILLIIGMLLSKFLGLSIITVIRIKKQNKMLEMIKSNPISMILFPISTFSIIIMQHALFAYMPIENNILSISVLICYSLLIMSNILVFDFINTLYKNTVNENRAIIAEELISSQTEQYKNILQHYNQIALLQHNHKNFCIGVLDELNNGNISSAIEYIIKEKTLIDNNIELPTDIINTILVFKANKAHQYGVVVDYETHQLQNIQIPSVDLAVILGNALDNAIEATSKVQSMDKKTICVLIVLKHNTILMTIKNPVLKDVDIDNLSTTKNDFHQHGFGLISMQQLAKKYGGEVLLSCSDNVFTTTILLHNSSHEINE